MNIIPTQDGSVTLYSKEFDQPYHTKSGAIEESEKKHVEVARLTDGMTVVDFCFGLGYNSIVATARYHNLHIIALELDQSLREKIQQLTVIPPYDKQYSLLQQSFQKPFQVRETIKLDSSTLDLIWGDATQTIKSIAKNSVDAIFFDPFSPQAHPQLWQASVFRDCFSIMKKGARLTTYSCARSVRDNMKEAGFIVEDGPIVGRRSPSTIAIKPI